MVEQRIQQQFFESADLQYRAADLLTRPIAEATAALLPAITAGGKVMLAGAGAGAALAPHMARLLAGRFERERPPLAALALDHEGVQQVRALGLPGDVLLYIDDGEGHLIGKYRAATGMPAALEDDAARVRIERAEALRAVGLGLNAPGALAAHAAQDRQGG